MPGQQSNPRNLSEGDVKIDEKNFPDKNFREPVKGFDDNENGFLNASETEAVTKIENYQSNMPVADKITKNSTLTDLNCSRNHLTAIDLTGTFNRLYFSGQTYLTPLYAKFENGKYKFDLGSIPNVDITKNKIYHKRKCKFLWRRSYKTELPDGATYDGETGILTVDTNIIENPDVNLPEIVYWYKIDATSTDDPGIMPVSLDADIPKSNYGQSKMPAPPPPPPPYPSEPYTTMMDVTVKF